MTDIAATGQETTSALDIVDLIDANAELKEAEEAVWKANLALAAVTYNLTAGLIRDLFPQATTLKFEVRYDERGENTPIVSLHSVHDASNAPLWAAPTELGIGHRGVAAIEELLGRAYGLDEMPIDIEHQPDSLNDLHLFTVTADS